MEKQTTFAELKAEIAKLQKQADQLRQTERGDVISRIKEAISVYELTAKDLGIVKQLRKPKRSRSVKSLSLDGTEKLLPKVKPGRYTDGKGNEWTGKGEHPEWVKTAIAAGRTLSDLKRKSSKPGTALADPK
jgi:DNA-binding protein H-NS